MSKVIKLATRREVAEIKRPVAFVAVSDLLAAGERLRVSADAVEAG